MARGKASFFAALLAVSAVPALATEFENGALRGVVERLDGGL